MPKVEYSTLIVKPWFPLLNHSVKSSTRLLFPIIPSKSGKNGLSISINSSSFQPPKSMYSSQLETLKTSSVWLFEQAARGRVANDSTPAAAKAANILSGFFIAFFLLLPE